LTVPLVIQPPEVYRKRNGQAHSLRIYLGFKRCSLQVIYLYGILSPTAGMIMRKIRIQLSLPLEGKVAELARSDEVYAPHRSPLPYSPALPFSAFGSHLISRLRRRLPLKGKLNHRLTVSVSSFLQWLSSYTERRPRPSSQKMTRGPNVHGSHYLPQFPHTHQPPTLVWRKYASTAMSASSKTTK